MELSEMLKAVKALPAEVRGLLDQNGQLEDEVGRLNAVLKQTTGSLEMQSDKVKELEDELAHVRVEAKSVQRNLQSQLDAVEKEKQLMSEELQRLRLKLSEDFEREPLANESRKAKETIAKLQDELDCLKQKYEKMQQEYDDFKDSVEKDYVPVALIEEGVRDYSEETDPEQGHSIFVVINVLLAGNMPWGKSAKRLKAYFKKAMKELKETKKTQNVTNQFEAGSSANVFNDKVEGAFNNG